MKLSELKLHYIGDVIGMSKMGKQLAKAMTTAEKKAEERRKAAMATDIAEDMGAEYSKFQAWLRGKEPSGDELAAFLNALEKEGMSRGEDRDTMIDDLMSPLTVDELKAALKLGHAEITRAARMELAHRNL